MVGKSTIEWTNATWNPVRGCSLVSEGCTNCYAMRQAHRQSSGAYKGLTRLGPHGPVWTGDVRFVPEMLDYPLRLKTPHMIFVNSMSDLFHEGVPQVAIDRIFAVMALARKHQFQVLTKRPEQMRDFCSDKVAATRVRGFYQFEGGKSFQWPLSNVWVGVSVEDQKTADARIPLLLETPAAVRWVSAEPLLGPIEFSDVTNRSDAVRRLGKGAFDGIHWVVVGGESDPSARPMHPDWARSLRDQCVAAGVPFFFKQWGAWTPYQEGGVVNGFRGRDAMRWSNFEKREGVTVKRKAETEITRNSHGVFAYPEMVRVGKKIAGRVLDGREWSQYPDVALGGA